MSLRECGYDHYILGGDEDNARNVDDENDDDDDDDDVRP